MAIVEVPRTEKQTPVKEQKQDVQQVAVEERIRARAYELFQARNCEPGHENDDWFQAEAELVKKPSEATKSA